MTLLRFFVTPWTLACLASLSFTISWALHKLMSIESVTLSNHLILCQPLLLLPSIFPRIRVFSNESALHIRRSKYWSFSIGPSNEHSGLISFRTSWFDLLVVQRTLKESFPVPKLENINSSGLSLLYGPTLTSVHDYWKNHSFDYMNLCQQSDVSAFKYTKFVRAFLSKSKRLLISELILAAEFWNEVPFPSPRGLSNPGI